MTEAPSPFSAHNPKLQVAWDSTSLGALMFCPRYYQHTILEGYRGSKADLEFGIYIHAAGEEYDKLLLEGKSWEDAQRGAVRKALEVSSIYDDEGNWKPWSGEWVEVWHCKGEEPYKNAKGNAAKCPYSHKGKWFPAPGPSTCGECGSDTEHEVHWYPYEDYKVKNRMTLIQTIVWYCEEYKDDHPVKPYIFPDGTPAVELSFAVPIDYHNKYSEEYQVCGHLDGVVSFGDEYFIRDRKSTKSTLSKSHFAGFSPNIQFDIYDLFGSIIFKDLHISGILVDAMQVMVGGSRFVLKPLYRSNERREELIEDIHYWLDQAEGYAEKNYWPMNRRNCWICGFKEICAKDPSSRKMYLEAGFEKSFWNPLEER